MITYERKDGDGSSSITHPGGQVEETKEKIDGGVFVAPHASVGFKFGYTKNLGNYESLRIEVSCYMPCSTREDKLDEMFTFVQEWCDQKNGDS